MPPARPGGAPSNVNSPIFKELAVDTAGFDDDLDYLAASKEASFVKSTGFIAWRPVPAAAVGAAPTEVAAPRGIITATAALGAQPGTDAAAQAAWRAASPLTTRLSTACLNRLAGMTTNVGGHTNTFQDYALYRNSIMETLATQRNVSSLALTAADLEEPTPFDTPAGVQAVQARRPLRNRPAQPAVAVLRKAVT